MQHWGIFTNNESKKVDFIKRLKQNAVPSILNSEGKNGKLFSPMILKQFIEEEERHDTKIISKKGQSLKTMSSGEQKKALLHHILKSSPDYIILDNPFDNLDIGFQKELKTILASESKRILIIQLASRKSDILPFINNFAELNYNNLIVLNPENFKNELDLPIILGDIPPPINHIKAPSTTLISFKNVVVSYGEKHVLKNINWEVKPGEFWQLIGSNGTGKTTILSMIIGDNPKAFGQEIYLFGNKKGSGESVWEIKEKIGYFTPSMTDRFPGRHSVENMLISGLMDSVGLYVKPSEVQKRAVRKWLELINLWNKRAVLFSDLSLGEQRLIMTVRSMVKHPPLLILDEPTSGMDDDSAAMLVSLVNKLALETMTTILFVSHRAEPGLTPKAILELTPTKEGSIGTILNP